MQSEVGEAGRQEAEQPLEEHAGETLTIASINVTSFAFTAVTLDGRSEQVLLLQEMAVTDNNIKYWRTKLG